MSRAFIILIFIISAGSYQYWNQREEAHPAGILISDVPIQKETTTKSIKYKDVILDPLAEYSIRGRVLSTERYWIDKLSKIVPIDVALGWREMSDSSVIDRLNIWQEGRFYFYSWDGDLPVDSSLIVKSSANMHLIPASKYIENEIKKFRRGQIVEMNGYLVRINFKDGTESKSSLAREDSGAGACEIMLVYSIKVK